MPNHAVYFDACMISYARVRGRKKPIPSPRWMLDSGAFTEVARNGGFRDGPDVYAETINRLAEHDGMVAAVAQDWMCEPFVVRRTGLSVREHQQRTVERYDRLQRLTDHYILPVIQGYMAEEYIQHIEDYGSLLTHGAWVGVGSVCKRSGAPSKIASVLAAIRSRRPDLRLHGFGVQLRALQDPTVRSQLATADSMAWSFNARHEGGDANSWQEAMRYVERVKEGAACSTCSSGSQRHYWQAGLSLSVCS